MEIQVVKRNGTKEKLNMEKIHAMVIRACEGLEGVYPSQVEMSSNIQFYDGITTTDIQEILIKSAHDLISLSAPNYQYVAARLRNVQLRKEVWGGEYAPELIEVVCNNIDRGVYDKDLVTYYSLDEWDELDRYIDHSRDYDYTYAGIQQVCDKYLVQDRLTKQKYETPQFMYILIAAVLFKDYPAETRIDYAKRYYDVISTFKLSLPTPIIAGVRTPTKQFASCVLVDIGDNLDSIYASNHAIGKYVSQRAGIGINTGAIRAEGSPVRNGDVKHTGVIPFLRMLQATTKSCTQNGIRGGASTNHFPFWHLDVEDFICLKNNQGTEGTRVREMDHCIQFSKLFYQRYLDDADITLFSPSDLKGLYLSWGSPEFDYMYEKYEKDPTIRKKTIKARTLLHEVLRERFETGRIYIQNIDHCNSHSHSKRLINMSNLCVAPWTTLLIQDPNTGRPIEVEISTLEDAEVNAWNGQEWSKVLVRKTGVQQPIITVTLWDDTTIDCTPYHKFYIQDEGGVKVVAAQDLKYKMRLETWQTPKGVPDIGMIKDVHSNGIVADTYCATEPKRNRLTFNGIVTGNCQEITLPTQPIYDIHDESGRIATCILSAINFGTVSKQELPEVCDLAVRGLDALIDYQEYPVKAAELYTKEQRSLGIGVINYAYFLAKNNVKWESQEAYQLAHEWAEALQYNLLKASNNLAKEVGKHPAFDTTKYSQGILPIDTYKEKVDTLAPFSLKEDWDTLRESIREHGLRNACVTALMPSESSAVVSNATNGIEPPKDFLTIKKSKQGVLKQVVSEYDKLKDNYELVWDMKSPRPYLNHMAIIQKFVDQSISTNTSYNPLHYPDNEVPLSVLVQDVLYAYSLGIKTLYYNNTYDMNTGEAIDEPNCDSGACAI